jgi:hypothetical protein
MGKWVEEGKDPLRDQVYDSIMEKLWARLNGEEKLREWLVGWRTARNGKMGILEYTGIRTTDTARKYERAFGMPIHRLPDGRPRAIPWELDMWLVKFSEAIKGVANDRGLGTENVGYEGLRVKRGGGGE